MRHIWTQEELIESFTLSFDELKLLEHKPAPTRIGLAALLKFFQHEGRFPRVKHEVPKSVITYIAKQVDVRPEAFLNYKWKGRSIT